MPPVIDEFTCAADKKSDYDKMQSFVEELLKIIQLPNVEDRFLSDDGILFKTALRHCKKIHPSYVDRLLLAVPFLYRASSEKILIASSNHKDIPKEFYDLVGVVAYVDDEFHNIGIYEFRLDNFNKMNEGLSGDG